MKKYRSAGRLLVLFLASALAVSTASGSVQAEEAAGTVGEMEDEIGNPEGESQEPAETDEAEGTEGSLEETLGTEENLGTEEKLDTEENPGIEEDPEPEEETTAPEETEEIPIPQQPAEPQAFSAADPLTGILAEAEAGVLPAGAMMIVTPIQGGEEYAQLSTLLTISAEKFVIYDISFIDLSTGMPAPVQPSGSVRISIPLPDGYSEVLTAVSHISLEGARTEIPCTVENGYAVFMTDHFSLFALMQKRDLSYLPSEFELTEKVEKLESTKAYPNGLPALMGMTDRVSPQTGENRKEN